MTFVLVFFAAVVLDVTWAKYTLSIAAHRPLAASLWSAGITLVAAVNVIAVVSSFWYVIPSALGAAAGTYVTVRHAA